MPQGSPYTRRRYHVSAPVRNATNVLTIPVRGLVVPITDPGAANGFGTAVIADFPDGDLLFLGAAAYLRLTKSGAGLADAFAGNLAIGSAPTADATLSGGEVDFVPSTAFTTAVNGVSAYTRYAGAAGAFTVIDNRNGALELNFNCFITDATLTAAASLIVDGKINIAYIHLGDDNS